MREKLKAAAVSALFALSGYADPDPYYNNSSNSTGADGWVAYDGNITLIELGDMLGRVGTFVIGTDPNDPAVGPLITGMLVMGIVVATTGSNRAGVVGGVVIGVATAAVLSQGIMLAPPWVYGAAVFVVGIAGASLLMRVLN